MMRMWRLSTSSSRCCWKAENVRLTYPHEGMKPDADVLSISAVMWW
jgi:hypothetical protein